GFWALGFKLRVNEALDAGAVETEAGHHFVENEQRALARAEFADERKVIGVGHDEADVAAIRFENDARDLAGVRGERGFEGRAIVVVYDDRLLGEGSGDAGAVGMAVRERTGAGFDEERVGVTVVTAGEFYDL